MKSLLQLISTCEIETQNQVCISCFYYLWCHGFNCIILIWIQNINIGRYQIQMRPTFVFKPSHHKKILVLKELMNEFELKCQLYTNWHLWMCLIKVDWTECDQIDWTYLYLSSLILRNYFVSPPLPLSRDVLFEYHRAVFPFCWAVWPIRSLSTLK